MLQFIHILIALERLKTALSLLCPIVIIVFIKRILKLQKWFIYDDSIDPSLFIKFKKAVILSKFVYINLNFGNMIIYE